MSFLTSGGGDKLTIDDGHGAKSYHSKYKPPDFTHRGSSGNYLDIRWQADCCGHTSGFKIFFYCFPDDTTQSKLQFWNMNQRLPDTYFPLFRGLPF